MAKKRRDKKVSLTQTKKKGLEGKHKLVDEIRSCVNDYEHIFVFSYENMRNSKLQDIKAIWRTSRFFLGKNKVMALALGRTSADEVSENLHLISEKLVGQRGLFFTKRPKDEVIKYFDLLQSSDFARAGCIATETVELKEGLLHQFTHTLEPYLRKLGLPTKLERGTPALLKSHVVCKVGEVLNSDQAKILKLLEIKQANFKITHEFAWSKDGSFEDLGRANLITAKQKKQGVRHVKKSKAQKPKVEDKELDENIESDDEQKENKEEEEAMDASDNE